MGRHYAIEQRIDIRGLRTLIRQMNPDILGTDEAL